MDDSDVVFWLRVTIVAMFLAGATATIGAYWPTGIATNGVGFRSLGGEVMIRCLGPILLPGVFVFRSPRWRTIAAWTGWAIACVLWRLHGDSDGSLWANWPLLAVWLAYLCMVGIATGFAVLALLSLSLSSESTGGPWSRPAISPHGRTGLPRARLHLR